MDVTIRLLLAEDAAAYRTLRLESLALHPTAFGADFTDEGGRPLAFFESRLMGNAIFGGFAGDALVGCAGLMVGAGAKRSHKGLVWGVYARPAVRGSGLARRLVEAVLRHAEGRVELVQLSVQAENTTALALYRGLGFEDYGREAQALKLGGVYYDEILMARGV